MDGQWGFVGFRGEHYHSTDDKSRVIIPLKLRSELGGTFVITRGVGPCLSVYREPDFRAIEERLLSQEGFDPAVQRMKYVLLSAAVDTSVDNQGRVAIPTNLREWAKIDEDEVVIVGMGDKIEIWSRVGWEALNASLTSDSIVSAARTTGLAKALTQGESDTNSTVEAMVAQ
jgi:MraZ protein